MMIIRRLLGCGLLCSLGALSGCQMLSSEAWQQPSVLSKQPPPPPEQKREGQGGFAVLVEAPGQPTSAHAVADIGAFAQGQGFVPQMDALPGVAAHYALGDIKLDVIYRTSDLRVVADLHSFSSRLNRKFVHGFYQDFLQQNAGRYGADTPIFENEYAADSGDTFHPGGSGARAGGSRRGGGR